MQIARQKSAGQPNREDLFIRYSWTADKDLLTWHRAMMKQIIQDVGYPLRSISLNSIPLVPLKEGQCSLVCLFIRLNYSKELSPFKGDEWREALAERNGGGNQRLDNSYIIALCYHLPSLPHPTIFTPFLPPHPCVFSTRGTGRAKRNDSQRLIFGLTCFNSLF